MIDLGCRCRVFTCPMANAFCFGVVDPVHNSKASDSLFFHCLHLCRLSRLVYLRHIFHVFHLFQNPQKQKKAQPKKLKQSGLYKLPSLRHPFLSCVLQTFTSLLSKFNSVPSHSSKRFELRRFERPSSTSLRAVLGSTSYAPARRSTISARFELPSQQSQIKLAVGLS